MRKTHVTFVNRDKRSVQEVIKDLVEENFNQSPVIELLEERIMRVSFKLNEETLSIIDSYGYSVINGLPSKLSINCFNLISQLVVIIEQNNSYYDEKADYYVQ